jgi:hypothetical protein
MVIYKARMVSYHTPFLNISGHLVGLYQIGGMFGRQAGLFEGLYAVLCG